MKDCACFHFPFPQTSDFLQYVSSHCENKSHCVALMYRDAVKSTVGFVNSAKLNVADDVLCRCQTHSSQSTATSRLISCVGSPTAVRIRTMVTSPALGILAAPTLASVAVILNRGQVQFLEGQMTLINLLSVNCHII